MLKRTIPQPRVLIGDEKCRRREYGETFSLIRAKPQPLGRSQNPTCSRVRRGRDSWAEKWPSGHRGSSRKSEASAVGWPMACIPRRLPSRASPSRPRTRCQLMRPFPPLGAAACARWAAWSFSSGPGWVGSGGLAKSWWWIAAGRARPDLSLSHASGVRSGGFSAELPGASRLESTQAASAGWMLPAWKGDQAGGLSDVGCAAWPFPKKTAVTETTPSRAISRAACYIKAARTASKADWRDGGDEGADTVYVICRPSSTAPAK
ncbi:hypothetical protein BS50DRAFT_286699 [Corynespora cassiicola Philippines]|uniref:Uncharacterized protein n=1 Tax=Corynespora cassiicola Philippines TaxID=1448308 RepID=A0A2T2P1T4_CORCC|nr:hypothetical protein BS50DRAFT_286699 [Corynespora cassiicola Philippines]